MYEVDVYLRVRRAVMVEGSPPVKWCKSVILAD